MTLITVLVSASAESTFLRGDSMNHEDDTNFNHRELIPGDYSILSGDAEVMVKEEENFASKPSRDNGDGEGRVKEEESQVRTPTRQLAECMADGLSCGATDGIVCGNCCNGHHLGDDGILTYCGPQTSCWGKNTYCVPAPISSCDKCCNSWSWYVTGAYCD